MFSNTADLFCSELHRRWVWNEWKNTGVVKACQFQNKGYNGQLFWFSKWWCDMIFWKRFWRVHKCICVAVHVIAKKQHEIIRYWYSKQVSRFRTWDSNYLKHKNATFGCQWERDYYVSSVMQYEYDSAVSAIQVDKWEKMVHVNEQTQWES